MKTTSTRRGRSRLQRTNSVLRRAIFSQHKSVCALCQAHEELRHDGPLIGQLLKLKAHPLKKKRGGDEGEWYYSDEYRRVCLVLQSVLGIPVEDLFPKRLYDHLVGRKNNKTVKVKTFTDLSAAARKQISSLSAPTDEQPENEVDLDLLRQQVGHVLRSLPAREQAIIKLRFGLESGRACSLSQIASILQVDREIIRQTEKRALRRLQHPARLEHLVSFV